MPEAESVEEVKGEVEAEGTTPEADESRETESVAETDSEETEPDKDEEAEPEEESDPIEELATKKYGGDRKKLVEGYWNLVTSGAKMHKKVQELEEALSNLRSGGREAPQEPEPDPEPETVQTLQWLDQQLTALDNEAKGSSQRQLQIINTIDKTREEIAELRGEIKRADDFDKSVLQQKLERAQERLEILSERWNAIEESKSSLAMRKFDLDHRKRLATAEVERSKATKRQQAEADKIYRRQFRTEFSAAVDKHVQTYGVDPDSKTRNRAHEYARGQAIIYLDTHPGARIEDVDTFVEAQIKEYLEDAGLGKKVAFTKLSAAKTVAGRQVQAAKVNESIPPKQQLPKAPAGKMTAAQALAYRKRIFGG